MKSHVVKPVPAVDQAGEHVLPGMLLHQVEPPGPIDLAGHGLAHRQRAVAAVYDDAISLLHRQNLGVCQGAQVPGLSAAFGIKCRLVQANGPASGCRTALRDLRGEVTQMGILVKKIRVFFPPLITGTVVFTIGLSLYPTAINYMAGGTSNPDYGSWQNWVVAFLTLAVVTALNHFGKGILKLASILIGILVGYVVSIPFGMVNLSSVGEAKVFQLPQFMHFGIHFEISACVAIGLLFAINSVQAIGDYSATTIGAMDRVPEDRELQNGIMAYGVTNILGALLGGLPTATYSQNVGIVTTTKVINRWVLGLAAAILGVAGIVPKFSALLTTIPQCVLGGATVSVFASIAMTGMKLVASAEMDYRNSSIVGLAAAIGVGVSQASTALASFPDWVTTIFGKSPVVLATLIAVVLNIILPKSRDEKKHEKELKKEVKEKIQQDHEEFEQE